MSIDTILGIVGAILGIIGVVAGYIFFKRSLRLKEPLFLVITNNLIEDNVSRIPGLEISYKGHQVQNLSVSKILFWNNGAETITRDDIANANRLRIESSRGKNILDVNIIKTNNPSSQFAIEQIEDGTKSNIVFDYLDKGQGAVLEVVHTGKTSNDITIKGDFKGAFIHMYSYDEYTRKALLVGGIAILLPVLGGFAIMSGAIWNIVFVLTGTIQISEDARSGVSCLFTLLIFTMLLRLLQFSSWIGKRFKSSHDNIFQRIMADLVKRYYDKLEDTTNKIPPDFRAFSGFKNVFVGTRYKLDQTDPIRV